jgi:predicted nucleotidyltransferase
VSAPAQFDELLRRLVDADVRFVLVGGLAVNAWGVIRGTKDLDIVADSDPANLARLAEVAESVGGQVQGRETFASTRFGIAALLEQGERVRIETTLGLLDVVQGLPNVPPYEELHRHAEATEVLGEKVDVCSLQDLRAMKEAAGRTRDLADLEDLDAAHGEG